MSRYETPSFPLRDYLPTRAAGKTVSEPARDIPVLGECDVAVFGGGPSGVCAATAAARQGASVVLVERHGHLGGTATAGNVNLLHPLYGTDGATQIIGGLPEELIRRLLELGAAYNSAPDGETGHWVVCSETAKFAMDDMVLGSGCRVLLDTLAAGIARERDSLNAVFVEGKSGREAIVARTFIDCTGDADLIRRAGCETQLGDGEGRCQAPSLCFRVAGMQSGAAHLGQVQDELTREPMDYNGEFYPNYLWGSDGVWDRSEKMMSGTRVLNVDCSDTLDLTRAEVEARYQLRWLMGKLRALPGWEQARLIDIASQVGLRESHRVIAQHRLTRDEVLYGLPFPDAIAQGTYPIDVHTPDAAGIVFERLDGTRQRQKPDRTWESDRWDGQPVDAPKRETLCYQVPYRCLVPRELKNVLVAGRCIGAGHDSAGAIRVMVNCMQFGEAAGIAAAMAASDGNVHTVDIARLQDALRARGVPLR